jgi:hypothetical protein
MKDWVIYKFPDGTVGMGPVAHWKWTMTPMGRTCKNRFQWVVYWISMYTPFGRLILKACGKTTWPEPLSWILRQRFFWEMIANCWLAES